MQLIESVGENLPQVIRDNSNILEHMTKNGILSQFYEDGLGLAASNRWISRMVKQICHRYPHMNILEIGMRGPPLPFSFFLFLSWPSTPHKLS